MNRRAVTNIEAPVEPDDVLTTAATWFERLHNEEPGADDIDAWQRWMTQSPAHAQAFERCQDLWTRLDHVPPPALPSRQELALDTPAPASRRWALAAALAAVAVLGAATLLWTRPATLTTVYETSIAEHREARLPDGSRLSLGARSLVWIDFAAGHRTVTLERGEAFFDVAADKQRPFKVRAGNASIVAIGTAFNVRRAGEKVFVSVTEGAVKVTPPTASLRRETRVSAGQRIELERGTPAPQPHAAATESTATWRSGRLQYLGEPLKYVIADVNRYVKEEIVIGDAAAGELLITATVYESDVQAWLNGLEQFLPITVQRREGEIVVRSRETLR